METLEEVEFVWTCVLLPASVILNIAAFLWLLKTAGSCYKDPIVPPLLSVIGLNILDTVLVQIFLLHQQSHGSFVFSPDVCNFVFSFRHILSDIPFLTISIQLIEAFRKVVKKPNAEYSHCSVCSSHVVVIFLPWLVSALANILVKHKLNGEIVIDQCLPTSPESLEEFVIHRSLVMVTPLCLVILTVITFLPTLFTKRIKENLNIWRPDFVLLSVLFAAYVFLQVPARLMEWAVLFNNITEQDDLFRLVLSIIFDLPLIINPLGVLLLRRNGSKARNLSTEVDSLIKEDEEDENITMMVSMEAKDLENALFQAKTTSL